MCNRTIGVAVVSVLLMTSASLWADDDTNARRFTAKDPFTPTVTQEESVLLQRVVSESELGMTNAIQLLVAAISKTSSPALDFALGNLHYQHDQFAEAEMAYVHAVRKLPTFRAALNNLARVYLIREKPRRAMSVFQSLLRDGQGDAQTYILLGRALDTLEQPLSSEGAFRHALLLVPGDASAKRGLARALIHQNRYPEVLALVKELQDHAPYEAELWSLRANALIALERYDEAIVAIETARLLHASPPDLMPTLGDMYLNRDQARDAANVYTAALASDTPDMHRIVRAAHALIGLDATDLARALADAAAKHTGATSPSQHHQLAALQARLQEETGEMAGAASAYATLIQTDPLDGASMLALARLYITQGALDDARVLLERATRIPGFEVRALIEQAQLDVSTARYDVAIPLLERAQSIREQSHVARYLKQVRRLATRQ